MAKKEYEDALNKVIAIDLNLNGEAFQRLAGRAQGATAGPYSNNLGGLNVGGYPDGE